MDAADSPAPEKKEVDNTQTFVNTVRGLGFAMSVDIAEIANTVDAKPVTVLDDWDFDHAGTPLSHLNQYPADGTFIRARPSDDIYHVQGGVPSYVLSWDAFGGPQPFVDVDRWVIDHAGDSLSHLQAPAPAPAPGGGTDSGTDTGGPDAPAASTGSLNFGS